MNIRAINRIYGCKFSKRILALLLISLFSISVFSPIMTVKADNENTAAAEESYQEYSEDTQYFELYEQLRDSYVSDTLQTVDAGKATLGGENKSVEYTFNVETAGSYPIALNYLPSSDFENDLIVDIQIDGQNQYRESKNLYLPRRWAIVTNENGYPFEKDIKGDDVKPDQNQVNEYIVSYFEDQQGLYELPYLFYLSAGSHTIKISLSECEMNLDSVIIGMQTAESYKDYISKYDTSESKNVKAKYQPAELTAYTSSSSLFPTYDKLDAGTLDATSSPNNPKNVLLNTVGGSNWNTQGSSISWTADVESEGLYRIVFRGRQNINSGLISYRKLLINGETPFKEAEALKFEYSQKWKIYTFADENGSEYLFHIKPGDVITLSCTTGDTAEVLRIVQSTSLDLTALYREIIAITSSNPDIYQDYALDEKIDNLAERLADSRDALMNAEKMLNETLQKEGSLASQVKSVYQVIDKFSKKTYKLVDSLSSFKTSLETLGTLIVSLSEQPLELDYMGFLPTDEELPEANVGFFKSCSFMIKQFANSFVDDYETGNSEKTELKLWVTTGRDQAQVLSRLIQSDFTTKTDIDVKITLIDTSTTLLKASLAGKGPDVAFLQAQEHPVELAARGALVDLTKYITDDVKDDFHPSTWTPFEYENGIYALPESQQYCMLFYRTDVFELLGIEVPQTWDELYEVMEVIQTNNLAVGIAEIDSVNMGVSAALSMFTAMLQQKGGGYYTDNFTKTQFDTEVAYEAFTDVCNFYTDYGLDRQFNFYSRFRTGEMVLATQGLAAYSQLQAAAPEIRGLWKMALMPGTVDENGNINRSEGSSVTGCIMLKAAEKRGVADEVYQFMKWWVSSDIQERYGRDLEIALGVAGRYFTANLEALEHSNWTSSELSLIKEQLQHIENQPVIPGSYALKRDLTSALREVIAGTARPRRALTIYNSDINEEIQRKRKEFGLYDE